MFLNPASFLCTLWASAHTCIYCIWFNLEPLFLANLKILAVIINAKFWVPVSSVWIKLSVSSNAELHYSGVSESLPSHQQCCALVVQGSTAVLVEPCSALGSAAAMSVPLLRSSWAKKILLPLAGLLGRCYLFLPGVPRGGYNFVWVQGCWGEAPALGRLCLKHWLAQSFWEVAAIDLTKLFVSPCPPFYTTIKPLWLVSVLTSAPFFFHHSVLKNVRHWQPGIHCFCLVAVCGSGPLA